MNTLVFVNAITYVCSVIKVVCEQDPWPPNQETWALCPSVTLAVDLTYRGFMISNQFFLNHEASLTLLSLPFSTIFIKY